MTNWRGNKSPTDAQIIRESNRDDFPRTFLTGGESSTPPVIPEPICPACGARATDVYEADSCVEVCRVTFHCSSCGRIFKDTEIPGAPRCLHEGPSVLERCLDCGWRFNCVFWVESVLLKEEGKE